MTNATAVQARGERPTGRRFDVVAARAVAALPKLAGWTMPLLADGGVLLALKGRRAAEEVAAAGLRAELYPSGVEELAETTVVVCPRQRLRA